MRKLLASLLVGTAAILPHQAAFAEDLALIIANFDARGFGNKAVTERELGSVEEAYRRDGFRVIGGRNLDAAKMKARLREFENGARSADRIVIHFVGEVLPSEQTARLRPFGFNANSLVDVDYAAPSLELIYDLLDHRPGRSLLVLATPTVGINDMIEEGPHIPNGLTIFAAGARDVNRSVRDNYLGKDATAISIGKSRAVSAFGFVSDIPFGKPDNVAAATPRPSDTQDSRANSALEEMRIWREATQNGSREALQGYVARYPNGMFRNEAQARLDALTPQEPLEQTIEKALNLNRDARRGIQRNLTILGFDTRGVDGVLGRGSRAALSNWQKSQGFRATGFIDGAQLRLLTEQARAKAEADRAAREREDLALWQQTGSGSNEQGLQTYLARFPEGIFAAQARAALEQINNQRRVQNNQRFIDRENRLNLVPKTRALVEQRLAGLGYKVGPVDGTFTDQTRIAIKQFQQKARLEATGYLDNQTVTKLVASIFQ